MKQKNTNNLMLFLIVAGLAASHYTNTSEPWGTRLKRALGLEKEPTPQLNPAKSFEPQRPQPQTAEEKRTMLQRMSGGFSAAGTKAKEAWTSLGTSATAAKRYVQNKFWPTIEKTKTEETARQKRETEIAKTKEKLEQARAYLREQKPGSYMQELAQQQVWKLEREAQAEEFGAQEYGRQSGVSEWD